jgi:hypothetical protein
MGDAGDAPGRVNYRVDALKQFCHDNARLAATGARDKTDVPTLPDRVTLFIR